MKKSYFRKRKVIIQKAEYGVSKHKVIRFIPDDGETIPLFHIVDRKVDVEAFNLLSDLSERGFEFEFKGF